MPLKHVLKHYTHHFQRCHPTAHQSGRNEDEGLDLVSIQRRKWGLEWLIFFSTLVVGLKLPPKTHMWYNYSWIQDPTKEQKKAAADFRRNKHNTMLSTNITTSHLKIGGSPMKTKLMVYYRYNKVSSQAAFFRHLNSALEFQRYWQTIADCKCMLLCSWVI